MTDLSKVRLCRDCKFWRINGFASCSYYQPEGDLKASRKWCKGDKHREKEAPNGMLEDLQASVSEALSNLNQAQADYCEAVYHLDQYVKKQLGMKG